MEINYFGYKCISICIPSAWVLVLHYVLVASKMEVSGSLVGEKKLVYMKECDTGHTSSTRSKTGKVLVQAWCQRTTEGGSETYARLWRTGMDGFVAKRREHDIQIKVWRLSKGLEVGQAWPRVWWVFVMGHWCMLKSCVAECLGPLFKWPWNWRSLGLVGCAVGGLDSWLF